MPTPKKSASTAATTTQMVLQFRDMKAPTLRTVFDNSILSEGMIRDPSAPRPRGRATDRRAAVKPYCARIMLAERCRVNALAQKTTGPVAEDHSIVPNSNPYWGWRNWLSWEQWLALPQDPTSTRTIAP